MLAALCVVGFTAPAVAQTNPNPKGGLPLVTFEARGIFPVLGHDLTTGSSLNVDPAVLPSFAPGWVIGANVYGIRRRSWALGLGGELLSAMPTNNEVDPTTLMPNGQQIQRTFTAKTVQMSLNFGHRAGWSYLTIGTGPTHFDTQVVAVPVTTTSATGVTTTTPGPTTPAPTPVLSAADGKSSINYGGGAKWFPTKHFAFTLDLRFYRTKAALATPTFAARDAHKVMVFSAGIAIR